jgi:hypothetical protein
MRALDASGHRAATRATAEVPITSIPWSIVSKTYSNKLGELRISQAYIKLLGIPQNAHGARMVSLERIGNYEVLMFDVAPDSATDTPLFWLELFDHGRKSSIDSCSCTEIAQAVTVSDDFISLAKGMRDQPAQDGSKILD